MHVSLDASVKVVSHNVEQFSTWIDPFSLFKKINQKSKETFKLFSVGILFDHLDAKWNYFINNCQKPLMLLLLNLIVFVNWPQMLSETFMKHLSDF